VTVCGDAQPSSQIQIDVRLHTSSFKRQRLQCVEMTSLHHKFKSMFVYTQVRSRGKGYSVWRCPAFISNSNRCSFTHKFVQEAKVTVCGDAQPSSQIQIDVRLHTSSFKRQRLQCVEMPSLHLKFKSMFVYTQVRSRGKGYSVWRCPAFISNSNRCSFTHKFVQEAKVTVCGDDQPSSQIQIDVRLHTSSFKRQRLQCVEMPSLHLKFKSMFVYTQVRSRGKGYSVWRCPAFISNSNRCSFTHKFVQEAKVTVCGDAQPSSQIQIDVRLHTS